VSILLKSCKVIALTTNQTGTGFISLLSLLVAFFFQLRFSYSANVKRHLHDLKPWTEQEHKASLSVVSSATSQAEEDEENERKPAMSDDEDSHDEVKDSEDEEEFKEKPGRIIPARFLHAHPKLFSSAGFLPFFL
jgi:hypothetical protein